MRLGRVLCGGLRCLVGLGARDLSGGRFVCGVGGSGREEADAGVLLFSWSSSPCWQLGGRIEGLSVSPSGHPVSDKGLVGECHGFAHEMKSYPMSTPTE